MSFLPANIDNAPKDTAARSAYCNCLTWTSQDIQDLNLSALKTKPCVAMNQQCCLWVCVGVQTVECPYSQTAAFCKIRQLLPNCGFFKQPQASLYCTSYCCFTTARFHLNWSLLVSGQNFGLGMSFGSHKLIYTARHLTTGNIFASIEASLSLVSGPRLLTSVATSSWPRGDEAKISSQMGRGQDPLKTHRFGYFLYQFNNHQY